MKVVVIGGGLVGCLLAIYLARRGHEVDVYERNPDGTASSSSKRPSINLTLCERGLRPLENVGLRERITSLCVPAFGRLMHGLDGSVVYQPYSDHREAIYSVSRNDLNDALLSAARAAPNVRIHFGERCTGIDLAEGSARMESTASGASQVYADHFFGADGAYSSVRAHLQRTQRLNYSQQYWNQGYKELNIAPLSNGTWAFDCGALHVWPRGNFMLIAFANRDKSFTCALHIPFLGPVSHESLATPPDLLRFLDGNFPDVSGLLVGSAERFFDRPANTMVTVRCDPWSFGGKVCLIGDAAHAILPSYGQGANAGFEDVALLDGFIEESPNDWGRAFELFEAHRRPDMDAMANLCVEHFNELRDHVADAEFLRRRELERRLHHLYPETYESLYSMITFSSRRYGEAIAIDRRQKVVVDQIISDAAIRHAIGQHDFESTLKRMIARSA